MNILEIDAAMKDLSSYIGTKSEKSRVLTIGSNNTKQNKKTGAQNPMLYALSSLSKITNSSTFDYTSVLYEIAHLPVNYDGYDTAINFVDVIRDKMSNLNQAIYTNILKNDKRFEKECYCAQKDQNRGDSYEGIMVSKTFQTAQNLAPAVASTLGTEPNDEDQGQITED